MKNPAISQVKGFAVRAALGFLLSLFGLLAHAQDIRVTCSQPACTITPTGGIAWANGNQVFLFRPIDPRVSIYIFIHNLNPTSAHTSQTISVFQTPFGIDTAPSLSKNSSRWTQDIVTQNTTAGASCNNVNANNDSSIGASGLGTCYVNTMFAAQVAIQITGANTQAGSPDNFEIAVVQHVAAPGGQTPGSAASSQVQGLCANGSALAGCGNPVLIAGANGGNARDVLTDFSGRVSIVAGNAGGPGADGIGNAAITGIGNDSSQTVILETAPIWFNGTTWDRARGTAASGQATTSTMQVFSDGLSQAFSAPGTIAVAGVAIHVNANSGAHSLFFDKVLVSCSAACTVQFFLTSTIGSTCTNGNISNLKINSGTTSTGVSNFGCGTPPTVLSTPITVFIPAGGVQVVDLRGFIAPNGTTVGFEVNNQTATTLDCTVFWYEK